jgi:hypothetical protein
VTTLFTRHAIVAVALVRFVGILAVISGVVLLVVDSPVSAYVPIPISPRIAEAIPLLLVGIACLGWLAVDRPSRIDLIKQILIAAAFILWGINLLMPPGKWSKFTGAVVIAIYVFDLAWLMEGNLRKKLSVATLKNSSACVSSN